jgi:hypothetical protein
MRIALRYARQALLIALLVIAAGSLGCWSQWEPVDACFAWPAEEACPSEDLAVFYLSALFHGCYRAGAIEPAARRDGKCCYTVTREYDHACDFGH